MLKILGFVVLGLTCLVGSASARGPAQKSPVQAPPPPSTARADSGYRTYSYEPGGAYRAGQTGGFARPSYLDARSKALGRY
jgi:hypothetical protein